MLGRPLVALILCADTARGHHECSRPLLSPSSPRACSRCYQLLLSVGQHSERQGPRRQDEPPSDGGEKDKGGNKPEKDKGGNKPVVKNDLPVIRCRPLPGRRRRPCFRPQDGLRHAGPGSLRVSPDGRRLRICGMSTLTNRPATGSWTASNIPSNYDVDVSGSSSAPTASTTPWPISSVRTAPRLRRSRPTP